MFELVRGILREENPSCRGWKVVVGSKEEWIPDDGVEMGILAKAFRIRDGWEKEAGMVVKDEQWKQSCVTGKDQEHQEERRVARLKRVAQEEKEKESISPVQATYEKKEPKILNSKEAVKSAKEFKEGDRLEHAMPKPYWKVTKHLEIEEWGVRKDERFLTYFRVVIKRRSYHYPFIESNKESTYKWVVEWLQTQKNS